MNINCNNVSNIEDAAEMYPRTSGQKKHIETGIANLADAVRSTCPDVIEPKKSLAAGFTPGPADVILARGKKAHNHAGNRRLRQMIRENLEAYSEAPTKVEKSLIVSMIMDTVRQESDGGGFVREKGGEWYEVGDRVAREKISSRFRDLLHTKYRSSSKAKAKAKLQAKAKAKENRQCNHCQQLGLNEYVESELMELPAERNAMQSHEDFSGIDSSDLRNSKPNTLQHVKQHPESDHGGIQKEKFPIELDLFTASDIWGMATWEGQNDTTAFANFDEAMDRPFSPVYDSDFRTIDCFPVEGQQPLHNGFGGIHSIEWDLNVCLV